MEPETKEGVMREHEQAMGHIEGMWMPKDRYRELLADAHASVELRRELRAYRTTEPVRDFFDWCTELGYNAAPMLKLYEQYVEERANV